MDQNLSECHPRVLWGRDPASVVLARANFLWTVWVRVEGIEPPSSWFVASCTGSVVLHPHDPVHCFTRLE